MQKNNDWKRLRINTYPWLHLTQEIIINNLIQIEIFEDALSNDKVKKLSTINGCKSAAERLSISCGKGAKKHN